MRFAWPYLNAAAYLNAINFNFLYFLSVTNHLLCKRDTFVNWTTKHVRRCTSWRRIQYVCGILFLVNISYKLAACTQTRRYYCWILRQYNGAPVSKCKKIESKNSCETTVAFSMTAAPSGLGLHLLSVML